MIKLFKFLVCQYSSGVVADGSTPAFWKSLEYFWLSNPGADMSSVLARNRKWDRYFEDEHSSKLAAAKAVRHDKLFERSKSVDKDVLARAQYLVAKYLFLENHSDASIQDWQEHIRQLASEVPQRKGVIHTRALLSMCPQRGASRPSPHPHAPRAGPFVSIDSYPEFFRSERP